MMRIVRGSETSVFKGGAHVLNLLTFVPETGVAPPRVNSDPGKVAQETGAQEIPHPNSVSAADSCREIVSRFSACLVGSFVPGF